MYIYMYCICMFLYVNDPPTAVGTAGESRRGKGVGEGFFSFFLTYVKQRGAGEEGAKGEQRGKRVGEMYECVWKNKQQRKKQKHKKALVACCV